MNKFYLYCLMFTLISSLVLPKISFSQDCSLLTASYTIAESRCASTGSILISASGGSGNYQFKVNGPVTTNYTSSNLITGLSTGKYLITVLDINTNCIYNQDSVTVPGTYITPGFTMAATGVTCKNGNNGSITVNGQSQGRAPFSYKIIAPSASGVGTVSIPGIFTNLLSGNYLIQLSDSCGAIQTRSITVNNYDWSINNYTVTKKGCDSISVTINLIDIFSNVTPHAIFNGYRYGSSHTPGDTTWFTSNTFNYFKGTKRRVTLFVKDLCGNIKSVIWNDTAIPNVNSSVSISNKACSTFSAATTSPVNLTSPSYCIYNSSNVLIACNTTGAFSALPYGSYCIRVTDACYDTTISRCFAVTKSVPSLAASVTIAAVCTTFTATVGGQTNLSNPNFCLYNSANVLVACNTTGIFPNIPLGSYCIRMVNNAACYDTTITRCFVVNKPVPALSPTVNISNLSCSTFTATTAGVANWNNPQFCLYNAAQVLIVCNSTGVFNNLPYGSYCIEAINGPGCYDTTIKRCFTVALPKPAVSATVTISNKTCNNFTAAITGQSNLNNPQYCLYNSSDVLISCNSTGTFNNVNYGSYCIKIQNNPACYDTLITRCFTVAQTVASISVNALKSCATIGTSDIKVNINSGNSTYSISLYSPLGALIQTVSTSLSSYTFLNMPNLISPLKYKVVLRDGCGSKDSAYIAPLISIANRTINISPQCPSSASPFGFSDVVMNITDNNIGGSISPKIIKKNGALVTINPTLSAGYNYTFQGLVPATYIFDITITDCNKHLYDTVIVKPYLYPNVYGTRAYQCDNGAFTLGASTLYGIAPYMYEIFGSTPVLPSIQAGPQASPLFNINNGTSYSLIRLRVVDGCGNASLTDASVLPLSNFIISPDRRECFNDSLKLRVDSIDNAIYSWYKRIEPNDSILVGTGATYVIPNLLPSDTGRYFCKVIVNNGCLIKISNYVITGFCNAVLPIEITLTGNKQENANKLNWKTASDNTKMYQLERSNISHSEFKLINSAEHSGKSDYSFLDATPPAGNNFYRLKIIDLNNKIKYSNVVLFKNIKMDISFYPNPVNNMLYVSITNTVAKNYQIEILNSSGQKISSRVFNNIQNAIINYPRAASMVSGMYFITVTDLISSEMETFKVIYK